tara:strand:- start:450 stop:1010 length:561 start_codon:yes stop_codon:yes gene_type:complete
MNSKKYYKRKRPRKSRQKRTRRYARRVKKNKTRRTAGMLGLLTGRTKSRWNPPPKNTTNPYTRKLVQEKIDNMRKQRHNKQPKIEKTTVREQKAAERAQKAVNELHLNLDRINRIRLSKEQLTKQKMKEIEHFIKTAPDNIYSIDKLKQEFEALKQDILADDLLEEFDTTPSPPSPNELLRREFDY